jgi:16S rRNA (cytosine1402-N4)-methyltransferase
MLEEVLELFAGLKEKAPLVLDCTLGAGGHAQAILESTPQARYIGIDADPEARQRAAGRLERFADRLEILPGFFDEVLADLAREPASRKPDFILFDLGTSTHHYQDSDRGFSFSSDQPLDMRFSPELELSAADIVNRTRENDLADLIFKYGEERNSRKVAHSIVEARKISPIRSSGVLSSVVADAFPPAARHGRIHPATRTFQALRIAVNDELGREERALATAASLVAPEGIIAVISFHSLEDRIAKHFCREYGKEKGFAELFKTPRIPSDAECARNPASRSAKLRALRAPEGGRA